VPLNAHVPPSFAQTVQVVDPPPVEVTVTENPQVAVWLSLDRAVTVTDVGGPTGNRLPEAGLPVTETGATPPEVVAAG